MNVTALIDRYCEAWTEPDPGRRANLLHSVWAEGARYTDPTVHLTGGEELLSHIARVQAQRPGAMVLLTSPIDAHHNLARFAWRIVQADGTALREGLDVVLFTSDGSKIAHVIGFYDS